MNWLPSLAWAIVGAVLSTALSYYLPIVLNWWQYRKRSDLLNDWFSTYKGIDEPPGTWVTEKLFVDIHGGQLRFKNADSSHQYNYTALGKLVQKVHIVGDWESIRSGANAFGAFILTVAAQGNYMFGYWTGPDQTGARRYGRWVLARTQDDIERAKRLLEEIRQPRIATT